MVNKIDSFRGEYKWLSNFYEEPIQYLHYWFPTNEHAYAASKCLTKNHFKKILLCETPKKAMIVGRTVKLRPFWDSEKLLIMYRLNCLKFRSSNFLGKKLIDTGDAELIEGNNWGDTFWGVCDGIGSNHLGKILMRIRQELRFMNEKTN